ncbi:MAG: class I SAM-dependent methyltransferase [Chloroflexi bacterium]|nr:class I SAM-dependent methyltransferase [Chloroflexota bacterium]
MVVENLQTLFSTKPRINSGRQQVLWRLAYAFLRLDQLPSGGWGKTLYSWMDKIWEGDKGTIVRTPDTRFEGGVDYTAYTIRTYYDFLEKVLGSPSMAILLQENDTDIRTYQHFAKRINFNGMIGEYRGRTEPEIRLRHTMMGFITFYLHRAAHGNNVSINEETEKLYRYIIESIRSWKQDKSHHYGLAGATLKLVEILEQASSDFPLGTPEVEDLRTALKAEILHMIALITAPVNYNPQPANTMHGQLYSTIFRPYGDFWRMERSCFLMHLPLFIQDNQQAFSRWATPEFKSKCAQTFKILLDEVGSVFDLEMPSNHLIRYHRPKGLQQAPRDWGLSAEFAALLYIPAIQQLLIESRVMATDEYERRRDILTEALVSTFDHFHQEPTLFKFTQAPSFSRILHVIQASQVDSGQLKDLDQAISTIISQGVTEFSLEELIKDHIIGPTSSDVQKRALRDLLITKLESGEHTPDGTLCVAQEWALQVEKTITTTIDFYESKDSDDYITRYSDMPRKNLVHEIDFLFEQQPPSHNGLRKALDVGCGVGQYAELLSQQGYEVSLLDASQKMLTLATQRANIPQERAKKSSIFDWKFGYGNEYDHYFDLIFACAIMIHVPEDKRERVYSTFHQLLKPAGILFVNYKLGDHSLISDNGRYFAYYRDDSWIQQELEKNGFQILVKIEDMNYQDMYGFPKQIRWAHYCCNKGEVK